MNEKPILFSGPMVRAILDGRKTQTRRCHIKPQPPKGAHGSWQWYESKGIWRNSQLAPGLRWKLPYQVGDLGWVRETWCYAPKGLTDSPHIYYRADYHDNSAVPGSRVRDIYPCDSKWRSSIHMFKRHTRLWLKFTAVRVERLQEISKEDAWAEGCPNPSPCDAREWFESLWDSLNGKKQGFAWADNPWIAVYEFERVERVRQFPADKADAT